MARVLIIAYTSLAYDGRVKRHAEALAARGGKIVAIEAKNNSTILRAHVPLAEMFGYATAMRSLSKGRAAYSMEPLAFEPVPASIVTTILDSAKPKPART